MRTNIPDPGSGRPEDRLRRLIIVTVQPTRWRRPILVPVAQAALLALGVAFLSYLCP